MVILYITLIQKVFLAQFVVPPWPLFAVQLYQGLRPWAHPGRLHHGLSAAPCARWVRAFMAVIFPGVLGPCIGHGKVWAPVGVGKVWASITHPTFRVLACLAGAPSDDPMASSSIQQEYLQSNRRVVTQRF